ncbi:MAG: undecaprenyl-diphosphate phosphatase [bacterium]|jgi:undecaprenyl-diphosphatase
MNEILTYILLGLVQGLTEFLPVSSSGHLIIAEKLLGYSATSVSYEVLLHLATLAAVFWVFWKDIAKVFVSLFRQRDKSNAFVRDRGLALWILVGSTATAAAALPFKDYLERLKGQPWLLAEVGFALLLTGILLITVDKLGRGQSASFDKCWWKSILIGLAQAVAVLPGISRSGSTIFASVASGLKREDAAKFSFLLSIPAILGAAAIDAKNITGLLDLSPVPTLLGMLAAFLSGVASIKWLIGLIVRARLAGFAVYCWILGAGTLAAYFIGLGS